MSTKLTPYRRALLHRLQQSGAVRHSECSAAIKAQLGRLRKAGLVTLGQSEYGTWGWKLTDAGRAALEGE